MVPTLPVRIAEIQVKFISSLQEMSINIMSAIRGLA